MFDPKKAHYISSTAIIIKDGKFLIAKRDPNEKSFPNKWTVPGGKLETKDYQDKQQDTSAGQWYNVLEDGLRREVMEEVGLEIGKINYLTSLVFIRPDGIPTLVLSMFANHKEGEVNLGEGLVEHAWVSLEEAKNYDLIDGIYEELEMMDNIIRGNSIGEWKKD